MKKYFLSLFLIFTLVSNSYAQSFNAYINRNNIPEGETFVLTLELKDSDSQTTPDLQSLSQDFTVLSVSNGYRTNIINSEVSKSRQWSLVMIPNSSGVKTIPSIKLDNLATQPIKLNVISSENMPSSNSSALGSDTPKFKLIGTVDNTSPYVQQQINYQVKLIDTGGLQGSSPFFENLNDDWSARLLSNPVVSSKIVNGQTLREITFNYALFPLKSGELTIPPMIFNGYYLTKSTRRDPFADIFGDDDFFSSFGINDVFANKNPVVLRTKPQKIKVLPAQSENSWWLPAKDVKIYAKFDSQKPEFKQGEATNRTIYLKATGVIASQLPEIKFLSVDGVKQYPEKPETEMKIENGNIVSTLKISNVYIPEKAGTITLPEITVSWFNTSSKQNKLASIPPYKAEVRPASASNNFSLPQEELTPTLSSTADNKSATKIKALTTGSDSSQFATSSNLVLIILLSFLGGIIVSCAIIYLIMHFRSNHNSKKQVISAAKSKDIKKLKSALLLWGKEQNSAINNLEDITKYYNLPDFVSVVLSLIDCLYSDNNRQFDFALFIKSFKIISSKNIKKSRKNNDPLPKLYQ